MKKIVLRYGTYAALAELIFFVLTWFVIWLFKLGHQAQGNIGWVDLVCPLIFIYFGIRYYREKVNNGAITFLKALQIGLLISLMAAFAFALVETTYTIYIEPDFNANLMKYDLEQYKKTLSAVQYAAQVKAEQQRLAISNNPVYNFPIMVVTITAFGAIITLISGLFLFKKSAAPSAAAG